MSSSVAQPTPDGARRHEEVMTMADTMLAERIQIDTKKITVEEIPIPEPGPGEVLIKVAYCGICHSDLSLIHGVFPTHLDVVTQGHEVSGTIAALGDGVTGWAVGDRVIPSSGKPCGVCRKCRMGDPSNCLNLQLMAFEYDGGWAQYVKVPAGGMTRVPDGVDMKQAALLADAVSTPFGAVVRSGQVHPGNAVGVWGLGGVGTHVVMLSKLAGAVPIIAIDIDDGALERAQSVGADYAFRSDDPQLVEKVHEATGGRMIDVAFDAVGLTSTTRQAVETLDNNGKVVVVGMSAQDIVAGNSTEFALKRKHIIGHLGYKAQDISMLAEMLKYKRLDLSRSVSGVIPLRDIEKGIAQMEDRDGHVIRILVDPWME